ncbi:thiamine phosphate synthase [Thermosediminibacter oceani]|uniref:Thiamine-phosphate synthase n=1 Tax=Thermosediminibacter oceani (strain ATCC BAA-1034 / DSM 16646 / JW/IW-1228P) TaxID=555079 RepID=D9RYY9_THEOJ|nr:thiamine phosphate synthase [Thermosediminibacter oceani]ADL06817.1 thiamine-phosphate diphosphorylase [Thermosediminibacter oceani DSM 16646]
MKPDFTLYAVTERSYLHGRDLVEAVEEAIRAGITVLQLREKDAPGREFYELALRLRELTRVYGIPFIINDRVDIALAVDADGVHVGQEDIPADVARKIIGPGKILGVSAKTVEEAIRAEKDGADYLGVGAIFPSPTKPSSEAIGLEGLIKIKNAVKIPVVAIGGITVQNANEVMATGVDGICCISAVFCGDITENVRALRRAISQSFFIGDF